MIAWIKSLFRTRGRAALLRQADAALREGAAERARELCLSVLASSPRDPRALALMANIAADRRQVEEGLRWAEKAIAADPAAAGPHYSAGRLWELGGRPDRAETSYRRALGLDPNHARAHNNLGCVLSLQGRLEEALACYRRALQIDPAQPEANQNLAAMTGDAAAQETSIRGYLEQIERDPGDARALANLASIYAGAGRHREALDCLDRAIALDPERAEARYSRAVLLLQSGDYARGWEEYAWRWRLNSVYSAPARRFATPFWDGAPLAGGTVFLHGESAFGESLQFVRYAPLVAQRCARVIFECAPQLRSLLERAPGVGEIAIAGADTPKFDAHLPLFELPRLFGTTLESIPWNGPYVHAAPDRIERWRAALASAGGGPLKVGLAWTGNPNNPNNSDRSVPPDALLRLREVPRVALYNLQIGAGAAGASRLQLIDLTSRVEDFSDTAALLHHLDLVISIDTSVAHLAGAMGRPVWVMLNLAPDWRYHLERSDNPWYPTMRLYRQAREGDWAPVVERVAEDLRKLAS